MDDAVTARYETLPPKLKLIVDEMVCLLHSEYGAWKLENIRMRPHNTDMNALARRVDQLEEKWLSELAAQ